MAALHGWNGSCAAPFPAVNPCVSPSSDPLGLKDTTGPGDSGEAPCAIVHVRREDFDETMETLRGEALGLMRTHAEARPAQSLQQQEHRESWHSSRTRGNSSMRGKR